MQLIMSAFSVFRYTKFRSCELHVILLCHVCQVDRKMIQFVLHTRKVPLLVFRYTGTNEHNYNSLKVYKNNTPSFSSKVKHQNTLASHSLGSSFPSGCCQIHNKFKHFFSSCNAVISTDKKEIEKKN